MTDVFSDKAMGFAEFDENIKRISHALIDPQSGIGRALADGAEIIAEEARRNVDELFNTSGDFPERIVVKLINQFRADISVDAVYGAVHEFGGTFTITEKQRAFFWAKYAEDQNDMWRALALSITYTIPPRPYLRPAIESKKDEAMEEAAWRLRQEIAKAVRFDSTR